MSYRKIRGAYDRSSPVPFTADQDYSAGDVVVLGDRVGVVHADVKNGERGVATVGTDSLGIWMPKVNTAIAKDAKVYWDPDGNPVTGAAGSGCVTDAEDPTHILLGFAAEAALAGDSFAAVHLTNAA
jgi:predicted RecA/RadA family phage recombinase